MVQTPAHGLQTGYGLDNLCDQQNWWGKQMLYALLHDFFQRAVSLNKWDQRRKLKTFLIDTDIIADAKMIDFGCGTGLFASLFRSMGIAYVGYDIETRFTKYAGKLYKDCLFTTSRTRLASMAPYHFILMNCCAHHMSDDDFRRELRFVSELLTDDGTFLLVDHLGNQQNCSPLRKLFLRLDQGHHRRSEVDLMVFLREVFHVQRTGRWRSYALLLESKHNPVYGDLVAIECKKPSKAS